jgi:hypothetical protein
MQDRRAKESLIALLEDKDPSVRSSTACALQKREICALSGAYRTLERRRWQLRYWAALALGNLQDPRAKAGLAEYQKGNPTQPSSRRFNQYLSVLRLGRGRPGIAATCDGQAGIRKTSTAPEERRSRHGFAPVRSRSVD